MKASIKLQSLFTQDYLDKNPHIVIDDLVEYADPLSFNPDTQKIGAIILVNGVATHEVIDLTPEEIAEANKPIVPEEISAMRLKLQLFDMGITDQDIFDDIDSIPDTMFSFAEKEKAKIKYKTAVTFQRTNAELNFVATMEGLTQEQVDEIFINGNLL